MPVKKWFTATIVSMFIAFILIGVFLRPVCGAAEEPVPLVDKYSSIMDSIPYDAVSSHVQYLSALGSRMTGYPGCADAANYIEAKFEEYGATDVWRQPFDVVVPVDYGATLTIVSPPEGGNITIYPLLPNSVQACPTPKDGLTGRLVYMGDGGFPEIEGKPLNESIILMNFNTEKRWLDLAMLGAKAFLFIEPKSTFRTEADNKYVPIPLNIPRFYVPREAADLLLKKEGATVNVKSRMQYEPRPAENVIGYIRGTDPDLKNEVVALCAHYDALSIAPSLAPGADESVGIATLIELVRFFHDHPPPRSVMFVALSGHGQGLEGVRQLIEEAFWGKYRDDWWSVGLKLVIGLDLSSETNSIAAPNTNGWWCHMGHHLATSLFEYSWYAERYLSYISAVKSAWQQRYGKTFPVDTGTDIGFVYPQGLELFNVPFTLCIEPFILEATAFSYFTSRRWAINLNTPLDTYNRVQFENLKPQLELVFCTLSSILNEPQLKKVFVPQRTAGERIRYYKFGEGSRIEGFGKIWGRAVQYDYMTGRYKPIPHAIVRISMPWHIPSFATQAGESGLRYPPLGIAPTYNYVIYKRADAEGRFTFTGAISYCVSHYSIGGPYHIEPYLTDSSGNILYAPDLGVYGAGEYPNKILFDRGTFGSEDNPRNFVAFECGSLTLHQVINPNLMTSYKYRDFGLISVTVNDFSGHYPPTSYGSEIWQDLAMVYVPKEIPVEIIVTSTTEADPLIILLNNDEENLRGVGYRLSAGENLVLTPLHYAKSLYYLNEIRLGTMERYGSSSPPAMTRHQASEKLLTDAIQAMASGRYGEYWDYVFSAWSAERTAYGPTKSLLTEITNSTVFFFFLLIPFALLAERLVVSATRGTRQMMCMMLIFILLAAFLYLFHPGFSIASNIYVLILGFLSLVLTLPILATVTTNASAGLREMRRKVAGEHFAEISRSSAVMLAFSLGVSQMRKRRFRTILMMTSLALVITCVSSAAAISTISITTLRTQPGEPAYTGIQIRRVRWYPLSPPFVKYIEARYGPEAFIAKRTVWYCTAFNYPPNAMGPKGSAPIVALWGLTPEEANVTLVNQPSILIEGRWLNEEDYNSTIISHDLSQTLGAGVNDTVEVSSLSLELKVVGILNETALMSIRDLDGEPLTPRDQRTPQNYDIHLRPRELLIIPYQLCRSLDIDVYATVFSVNLRFKDPERNLLEVASDLSLWFESPIYVGSEGKIYYFEQRLRYAFQASSTLIVPIAIAILILLNMMIGSVHERIREVTVMSSLGLSPLHIFSFFLAEALVYAVVGSGLGYMGGTLMSWIVSTTTPEAAPNYSSWVVAISVATCMLVTLLSSIYPGFTASRLVTPSLERKWKIDTKPVGDEWTIPLPFKMRPDLLPGVMEFLKEYFQFHESPDSLAFSSRGTSWERRAEDNRVTYTLTSTVRLEPYELGVEQRVSMNATSEAGAEASLQLHIHRITGVLREWTIHNYPFLSDLREQFLIWGGMPPEKREPYLERGASHTR